MRCAIVLLVVNTNLEAQKLRLRQHRPFTSINRLTKHSRWDKWQDKVSFCSLIRFNWRVPARVPLFSLGLKVPLGDDVATASGRLSKVVLTHYRRREVRNSIYRYWKIHIDYRSKFSYRFISSISIIYGNTKTNKNYISFLSVIVSVERPVIMTSNTYFRMTRVTESRITNTSLSIRIPGQGVESTLAN